MVSCFSSEVPNPQLRRFLSLEPQEDFSRDRASLTISLLGPLPVSCQGPGTQTQTTPHQSLEPSTHPHCLALHPQWPCWSCAHLMLRLPILILRSLLRHQTLNSPYKNASQKAIPASDRFWTHRTPGTLRNGHILGAHVPPCFPKWEGAGCHLGPW